ncbi:Ribonuclease P protein subunit p29 [Quillaja saponaria]|uniref:Ribonuclease P protein subunit p29 n=1 Tax=Quillaja saponaria TaxID=32244 RepID=A0AAD7Q084_QUISA|nr:Ribonuclease P protein subunit p29 [Quillaja saponaria]
MATDTAVQDSTKRALEALDMRFAVEILLQQKSLDEKDRIQPPSTSHSSIDSSAHVSGASDRSSLSYVEESGSTYLLFSQTVHENLLATNEESISPMCSRCRPAWCHHLR